MSNIDKKWFQKTKDWYEKAYSRIEIRREKGYGWPDKIDTIEKQYIDRVFEEKGGGNALDIGCGDGRHSVYLAKKGFNIVGVDFSINAISSVTDIFRQNNLNGKFLNKNILEFNSKEKFDLIVDYSVSTHIPIFLLDDYASRINRLLKNNGYYIWVGFSAKDKDAPKKKYKIKNGQWFVFFSEEKVRGLFKNFQLVDRRYSHLVLKRKSVIFPNKMRYLMLHCLFQKKSARIKNI